MHANVGFRRVLQEFSSSCSIVVLHQRIRPSLGVQPKRALNVQRLLLCHSDVADELVGAGAHGLTVALTAEGSSVRRAA